MASGPKLDERGLRHSGGVLPAFFRRFAKSLPALIICGVLGGIRVATAGDAPAAAEAPLVVTTGYGVSGLVLWLAADSGVTIDNGNKVTALADKTGNFTLTPASLDQEPTYVPNGLYGRPVLRFNGNQSLYSPDDFGTALNRDMTIITVAMTPSSPNRFQYLLYLGQNATSHANRALSYWKGTEVFDGQFVGCTGEPAITNTFVMTGASINSPLTQATFYRNGTQTMVSNLAREINGDATFENLSDGVTMGAAPGPCRGWEGDIAEELVYNHQLSPVEMQFVWVYLSKKYGLHPTDTTQPSAQAVLPAATKGG